MPILEQPVSATQSGGWINSVVSSTPSSMLVGASIIGLTPVTAVITGNPSISGTVNITGTPSISGTINVGNNASVSGTVGASVIGMLPAGSQVIGSITALQGTNPWIIGSVSGTVNIAGNPSISGTVLVNNGSVVTYSSTPSSMLVGASIVGLTPVTAIITGNPSISGTVLINNGSVVTYSSIPSSMLVGASIIGLTPVTAVVTGNPSISGTVLVNNGSVVAFQGTAIWNISSVYGNVSGSVVSFSTTPSSMLVGASIVGLPPVNVTNTNLNVGGSVLAFQATTWPGSVLAFQGGTQISSVVSANPSSMLVGASLIGLSPVTATITANTSLSSVISLGQRNDTLKSVIGADLTYYPHTIGKVGEVMTAPAPFISSMLYANVLTTTTGSIALLPAQGTSVYSNITTAQIYNASAVPARVFLTYTASVGGASIIMVNLPAPANTGYPFTFPMPLRGYMNTIVNMQASALTAPSVFLSVQGFQSKE